MNKPYFAPQLPDVLPENPLTWAEAWLAAATEQALRPNPNSMTLVSVDEKGRPSARIVLCKAFHASPGYVVFHTNYLSRKSRELEANPDSAVVFHWDRLGRQVRIEGPAVKSPPGESDAYFESRPRGSQIGAWGSDQSRPIQSRDALVKQMLGRARELGATVENGVIVDDPGGAPISRPPHWGGYRVWARTVELWIEGADRIHDRAVWTRELEPDGEHGFSPGAWRGTRLQP